MPEYQGEGIPFNESPIRRGAGQGRAPHVRPPHRSNAASPLRARRGLSLGWTLFGIGFILFGWVLISNNMQRPPAKIYAGAPEPKAPPAPVVVPRSVQEVKQRPVETRPNTPSAPVAASRPVQEAPRQEPVKETPSSAPVTRSTAAVTPAEPRLEPPAVKASTPRAPEAPRREPAASSTGRVVEEPRSLTVSPGVERRERAPRPLRERSESIPSVSAGPASWRRVAALEEQHRWSEAADILDEMRAGDPGNAEVRQRLGLCLVKMEAYRRGAYELQRSIRMGRDSAIAWHFLGHAYEKTGMENEAFRAFQRAVDREPQNHSHYTCGARFILEACKRDHTFHRSLWLASEWYAQAARLGAPREELAPIRDLLAQYDRRESFAMQPRRESSIPPVLRY